VDLTRVAGANPSLWADILVENRLAVAAAIDDQVARLEEVRDAVAAADREWLASFMRGAAAGRARLREAPAEALAEPWRVVVAMPNRPGVISEVATILGHAHINIEDLSLRSGAGEDAGELSVVVAGAPIAERARSLVADRGYTVRVEPVG
jgi:prephenate dehydrogenase